MSDIIERAEVALAMSIRTDMVHFSIAADLVAALKAARAERDNYRREYEEIKENHALCGLYVRIPHYGEWGSETLMRLFNELGVKPEDDLKDVITLIERLRANAVQADK